MKKSKILKKARNLIASKEHYFVCIAIEQVCDEEGAHATGEELKRWVNDLIGNNCTLNDWLMEVHGISEPLTDERYHITRLAWIDWMIKHWKAQGN